MKKHKYGLKIVKPKENEHILGGVLSLTKEILQPDKDWVTHLPIKEYQNLNSIEPYACVSFTILNCIEILIKRKYGEERNYSDRFLAAVSGTKEGGNDPHIVCEFLRKVGIVPQELWAFDESIKTFEDFYAPLPPKLYELAQDFNKEWEFGHEWVKGKDIDEALQYSPLLISVYAWVKNKDGIYYRPQGETDIHATTYVKRNSDSRLVFDSYDTALKDYDLKSIPLMAKRFWIKKKDPKEENWLYKLLIKYGII